MVRSKPPITPAPTAACVPTSSISFVAPIATLRTVACITAFFNATHINCNATRAAAIVAGTANAPNTEHNKEMTVARNNNAPTIIMILPFSISAPVFRHDFSRSAAPSLRSCRFDSN
ncbi:hypothetical protein GCM10009565_53200 [Amycolatopsis albidoflavus]